ncbi:MAG: hypothetical protein WCO25_00075 [Candidatus Uhrbacteria bacterium]
MTSKITRIIALGLLASFCLPLELRAEDTASSLQARLREIEAEIASDQQQIVAAQGKTRTYASAIAEIAKSRSIIQLQMEEADLQIRDAEDRRNETRKKIDENSAHRDGLRGQLANLLVAMNMADGQSPLFAFLKSDNVFDAMNVVQQYVEVADKLNEVVATVKTVNEDLATQNQALEDVADEARNLLSIHALQETALVENEQDQKGLLAQSKGKEWAYAADIKTQKTEAAKIRTRIYQLLDTGSVHITFGEAVTKAKWVSGVTGIDPAFLLSVLTQESNLGANVGTCNRPQDPPAKGWKVVMKPTRDQEPFKSIMNALGRSTEGTPISCPMHDAKGNQIGWGGAMGPAQFIPSTWIGYSGKISAITGKASDPWNITDAFLAAALKLTHDGANGTENGNWTAAMYYFSGSTNVAYRFYGDQVITRAKQYQKDINSL